MEKMEKMEGGEGAERAEGAEEVEKVIDLTVYLQLEIHNSSCLTRKFLTFGT
jgi:hypothetical protein